MSIEISKIAYNKIMLHILKHIKKDCFGFLIGKFNKDGSIEVVDAYAFSHDNVFVPQVELFMKITDYNHIGSQFYVIGMYENLLSNINKKTEVETSLISKVICEGMSNNKKTEKPIVIEINNNFEERENENGKNKTHKDTIEYNLYRYSEKELRLISNINNQMEKEEHYNSVKIMLSKCIQNEIFDFDDHLLDTKKDYTNSFVDSILK